MIVDVSHDGIRAIQAGQRMSVHAAPDTKFAGKVTLVGPEVADKTRTVSVRVELENPDMKLKPGMFTDVDIVTETIKNAIAIPDEAIQRLGDETIVFIAGDGRNFAKRPRSEERRVGKECRSRWS